MSQSRQNNFDLIRLLAAIQVMLYHGLTFFNLGTPWQVPLRNIVSYFPGVPIFFAISGFLIYKSLERNSQDLKRYFKNRLIRIFPALWVCLLFTITLLFLANQITLSSILSAPFATWFLAQISIAQFYKIPLLSNWGVGHPNGSLWSISVELQYYFFLPLLFISILRLKNSLLFKNTVFFVIALISIFYNQYREIVLLDNELTGKILGVVLVNYLYFFCFGILIHLNFNRLKKFLIGKGGLWLIVFIAYNLIFKTWLGWFHTVYETSLWGVIGASLLAIATISLAYSFTTLSQRLLKGNDISYGIYIYHMPIFNYFYHQQSQISSAKLIGITALVILAATLSWQFVESRLLKFKA
ncbi:MAG: peptidoglycan/LPS O-acetylase OafA/YrhL [Arcticibacterium sp.]